MAKSDPDTVVLHGRDSDVKHGVADGSVTPGHLVEVSGTSDGERQYATNSSADTKAAPTFAREYGKTGRGIDDDYSDGDSIEVHPALPGDEIYAFLADSNDISEGDLLASDGAGGLQAPAAGEEAHAVARAVEALNNTSGSQSRIKVEVL